MALKRLYVNAAKMPGKDAPLSIGERGENAVTEVVFDFSSWRSLFGPGAIQLLVKRAGDADAYPVVLETEDGYAFWVVSNVDTNVQGVGRAEYFYTVDEQVAKSVVFWFRVDEDIGQSSAEVPDPYVGYVERIEQAGAETLQNAQDAEESAQDAAAAAVRAEAATVHEPMIGQNGNWWVWDQTVGAYVDTGYAARGPAGETGETGPAGKSAYASAQDGGYSKTEAQFNTDLAGVGNKQAKITARGILKGDGSGGVSAAVAGADYALPTETVTVTGSTPTINAVAGKRYVCGEVTTLDITLPASGVVDVTFESGSPATVLTITPPTGQTVRWANGFDPTSLDANTTYEINIADGLGVAASWT